MVPAPSDSSGRVDDRRHDERADETLPAAERTFDLLLRARSGDQAARRLLAERLWPRVYNWASGRLPAAARGVKETGDLASEVLTKILRCLDGSFEPRHPGELYGYLRRSIRNAVIDERDRATRRPRLSGLDRDIVDPGRPPDEVVAGREFLERYEVALERLEAKEREGIFLRIELGYGWEEVGELLDMRRDAARMMVSRALAKLAQALGDGHR